jgi:hypothetical protein
MPARASCAPFADVQGQLPCSPAFRGPRGQEGAYGATLMIEEDLYVKWVCCLEAVGEVAKRMGMAEKTQMSVTRDRSYESTRGSTSDSTVSRLAGASSDSTALCPRCIARRPSRPGPASEPAVLSSRPPRLARPALALQPLLRALRISSDTAVRNLTQRESVSCLFCLCHSALAAAGSE